MQATIVIDRSGTVRFAEVSTDWLMRTEQTDIDDAVRDLTESKCRNYQWDGLEPAVLRSGRICRGPFTTERGFDVCEAAPQERVGMDVEELHAPL